MITKDLKQTIEKISTIEILDTEINDEEEGIVLRITYDKESFFVFLKNYHSKHVVINIVNPISFLGQITDGRELHLANEFNTIAIASKCLLVDKDKKHYMFVREEIIRNKDVFNKDLIESRIMLSLSIVIGAVGIFESIIA